MTLECVQSWRAQNPVFTIDGRAEPLDTHLEDRDTADVADMLLALHRGS